MIMSPYPAVVVARIGGELFEFGPFSYNSATKILTCRRPRFWAVRIEGVRGEKNYTALVLEAIASGRGEIVSYDHLCMEVFGNVSPATKVRLGSVVARIRARLDKMHHLGGNYLVTCHGVGYMLATDGNQHRR